MTLDDLKDWYARFLMENWPYLRNGERYGLGYYDSLIGSGIRPFRRHKNHQPWMTCKVSDNQ